MPVKKLITNSNFNTMKKFFLAIAIAMTGLAAHANTTVNTISTPTTLNDDIKNIELEKNMVTSKTKLPESEVSARKLVYLGLYNVYLNGQYIGTYHVYLITN